VILLDDCAAGIAFERDGAIRTQPKSRFRWLRCFDAIGLLLTVISKRVNAG